MVVTKKAIKKNSISSNPLAEEEECVLTFVEIARLLNVHARKLKESLQREKPDSGTTAAVVTHSNPNAFWWARWVRKTALRAGMAFRDCTGILVSYEETAGTYFLILITDPDQGEKGTYLMSGNNKETMMEWIRQMDMTPSEHELGNITVLYDKK